MKGYDKSPILRVTELIGKAAGYVLIIPIRMYQRFISPCLPARCKYYPSCSHYAVRAIKIHGAIKGSVLAVWRILRCNPWSRGGVDYVPGKFEVIYFMKTLHEPYIKDE